MKIFTYQRENEIRSRVEVREDEKARLDILNRNRKYHVVAVRDSSPPAIPPTSPANAGGKSTPSTPAKNSAPPKDPANAGGGGQSSPSAATATPTATPPTSPADPPKEEKTEQETSTGDEGQGQTALEFEVPGLPAQAREALVAKGWWNREAILAQLAENEGEGLTELQGLGPASLEILRREVK